MIKKNKYQFPDFEVLEINRQVNCEKYEKESSAWIETVNIISKNSLVRLKLKMPKTKTPHTSAPQNICYFKKTKYM